MALAYFGLSMSVAANKDSGATFRKLRFYSLRKAGKCVWHQIPAVQGQSVKKNPPSLWKDYYLPH
ncbi:hypothetical protein OK18_00315 [Chryseobacterium gallinarum]|uniref:Uncharacterized protein n=1 Tax=Chryseobacterium gallinarum TaxID=1324352 RepID=A0A0G3LWE7_CHRGL|nr:hypothetical protein OK18_00315 [Chryseobacterium gallinarum]